MAREQPTQSRVDRGLAILRQYQAGKEILNDRIVMDEEWYRVRHWDRLYRERHHHQGDQAYGLHLSKPASAWLFNSLANKHADMMDNLPEPVVFPREMQDEEDAQKLSEILPVVFERAQFPNVYSEVAWAKLKHGTGAYGVFWDASAENGLGEIAIKDIDVANLYWDPGVERLEDSPNVFLLAWQDTETLKAQYPQLADMMTSANDLQMPHYVDEAEVDIAQKSVVVDWYYKVRDQRGKTVLHYCKFVGDTLLFSSEDAGMIDGLYADGQYPFVLDALYPIKGTPAGFGFIDIMQDPQMYIDALDEIVLLNARMVGVPRWLVRDDPGVNLAEFWDWHKPFVTVAGGSIDERNFNQINLDPLPAFVTAHLQNKIMELKETSGNRDFNTGGASGGVTSGAAISALQEAGNKLSRDILKGSYEAAKQVTYRVIERIRQFWTEDRIFRIIGQQGQVQYVNYSNVNIQPQVSGIPGVGETSRVPIFDIDIKVQKNNPFSQLSANQSAMEMFGAGFLNPELAEQSLTALEMMDFEGKEKVEERLREGQTLLNIVQQQQVQIQKLMAAVDVLSGSQTQQMQGQGPAPTQAEGGVDERKRVRSQKDSVKKITEARMGQ